MKITVQKVKSHTSIIGNEIEDKLANEGTAKYKEPPPQPPIYIQPTQSHDASLMYHPPHTTMLSKTCILSSTKDNHGQTQIHLCTQMAIQWALSNSFWKTPNIMDAQIFIN